MYEFQERDWKMFRRKLPEWQEAYMRKLCDEYIRILNSDREASDRFWELHDRINKDQKNPGVIVYGISRSHMWEHILEIETESCSSAAANISDICQICIDFTSRKC